MTDPRVSWILNAMHEAWSLHKHPEGIDDNSCGFCVFEREYHESQLRAAKEANR